MWAGLAAACVSAWRQVNLPAVWGAAARGNRTLVVDMSRTQFCDSAALHVLVRAHKRAQAEDREVRLVITAVTVLRIFAVTGIDHLIPNFPSLQEALAPAPAVPGSPPLPAALPGAPRVPAGLPSGAGER